MKNILLCVIMTIGCSAYAQIGIGTNDPKADLHVNGDVLIKDDYTVSDLPFVKSNEENFMLLTRVTNSEPTGQIKVLDVTTIDVAPINTVNYKFTNVKSDNITDVDLQFDTSKYIVGISNFRYDGDPIKKVDVAGGTKKSIGQFVVHAFEDNGTWHIEIKNRNLDSSPSDTIDYYVTLVVYNRSFFRQLPSIYTDMGYQLDGVASSTPTLN